MRLSRGFWRARRTGKRKAPIPASERILADLEDEQRSLALLEEAGFREPKSIRSTIRRVLGEKFPARRSPKAWQSLHRLFPSILQGVLETTAPDQALFRLESFMESIGPRGGYYALLEENPKTLERLISLFGGSALLSRWLTMHLEAVDALIDRGHYRPSREKGELLEEVESLLDGLNDSEERLGRLRAVRAQEILRIGAAELWGALGPAEVGKELTNLGEIFLEMTFREVLRTMGYSSDEPYPPLCILGLGTFGGEALSYRSDLDLLLVYEDDERWGQKGGSSSEHLAKLGQKLLSWMSMPMREGPGWEVDVRLRPSGNRGPLLASTEAFIRYHRDEGKTWERQMLLKARFCAGDPETAEHTQGLISELFEQSPPPPRNELHEMRMRMEHERGGKGPQDHIHLKLGPGGLTDIDFLVQYYQLSKWAEIPGLRTSRTPRAVRALVDSKVLSEGEGESILNAYSLYKGLENRLGLVLDHRGTDQSFSPEALDTLGDLEGQPWIPASGPGETVPNGP